MTRELPSVPDIVGRESIVLATVLESNGAVLSPKIERLIDHAPESFTDPRHAQIAVAFRTLRSAGRPVHLVAVQEVLIGHVRSEGVALLLAQLPNSALPLDIAELESDSLWNAYVSRRAASIGEDLAAALNAAPGQAGSIIAGARRALEELDGEEDSLVERLDSRRFNPKIQPPAVRPVYTLAGHIISTPGNLDTITSAIKTGKSAVIGAMAASAMTNSKDVDVLGFRSSNPKSHALLHFDSEQSPDDHWHQVARALKRAGLQKPPEWFYSYCLTGLGSVRGWNCVLEATTRAAQQHGGVHSLLIDGVADLVVDVNDPAESNAFVASLHEMAIENDCPIIGVIHFNPGGEKVRGHLGSQFERKAETNLRLDKTDGVTTIWSDKQRRAPIPKDNGPCFQWSEAAGMHVTVESRQSAADKERLESLTMLAEDLFCERPSMSYSDLIITAKNSLAVSDRTAARRISELSRLKVIVKSVAGLWTKTT